MKLRSFLAVCLLAALAPAASSFAQESGTTFTVQNGAFPWYDRVNVWSLDSVPDSLKSDTPIPQANCSSRGLEVAGTPKAILIGVSESDLASMKSKYPGATETGDSLAVKNGSGQSIPYKVLKLENPPAKIEGGGQAGLLLLKIEGAAS